MTQSVILYICEQHACLMLQTAENEQLRSGALHPSRLSAQRELRLAGTSRNICLPSTHALPLSTARQLVLPLAFAVVRAKLLLYLNNTALARTYLQLLNCFWCARALSHCPSRSKNQIFFWSHGQERWHQCRNSLSVILRVFFHIGLGCAVLLCGLLI